MDVRTCSSLSQLLDEALELSPPERERWLDGLSDARSAHRPALAALFRLADEPDADAFLATLPRLTSGSLSTPSSCPSSTSASDRAPNGSLAPGDRVGHYRLIRPLARGGHGAVWLATRADGLIDRPVAIKIPLGLTHRSDLRMVLARERDILAGLTHPHIARLYDAGVTTEGVPFLALEYVEGLPITEHCERHALDIEARLRLFQQVVSAVAHAHGRLVIHRDLKPTNVLVTRQGDVRLLDFGIAALMSDEPNALASPPTVCGHAMTLPYASPEQIRREPLGVASDIYSLGVVLYELLVGVLPHSPTRDTPGGWEQAILEHEPTPPSVATGQSARRRLLAGDLDSIVLKALRKSPGERYATAAALGEDLDRHRRGLPVEAQGESRAYRARKFILRHRWGALAAAATVAALLIGVGVATWQMHEARAQRDVAQHSRQRAEAFSDFLETLLLDAGDDGRPLTTTELLDRGTAILDRQRGLTSRVAAYMHLEVSRLYLRFDQADREREQLARSAEAAQRIGDVDLYAAARCATAASLATHDRAGAAAVLQDVDAALAASGATAVLSRVDCARARARLRRANGDLAGAMTLASAALGALDAEGAANESQRELLRRLLSELYKAADQPQEALRLSAQSLQRVRDAGRSGTLAELDALSKHAGHLYRVGEARAAAVLQQEVLDGLARLRPRIEPVGYRSDLGLSLIRLGQAGRAMELIATDLALAESAKSKPTIAIMHLNLSRALLELRRLQDARQHLAAADDIWRADPAAFRRMLTESSMQHAALSMGEGRAAEGRAAADTLLRSMGYPERQNASGLDRALRLAASMALDAGDFSAADRLATDALVRARGMARDPRRSADVGLAALTRARAQSALGHAGAAHEHAALAATALSQGLGEDHPDTMAARELLAAVQQSRGEVGELVKK